MFRGGGALSCSQDAPPSVSLRPRLCSRLQVRVRAMSPVRGTSLIRNRTDPCVLAKQSRPRAGKVGIKSRTLSGGVIGQPTG